MNAITFGDPTLFAKGMVEAVVTEPSTGNIVGYDRVSTDYAMNTSMNLGPIEGGNLNALILNIPDTMRLNGTLTSQAFDLEHRAHILGSSVSYNAVVPVCETITASSATLTVSKTPAKSYAQPSSDTKAWCYVRVSGAAEWTATNYSVDISTKAIQDFVATNGVTYDVQYFISNASAKVLPIKTVANPKVLSLSLKYGVYSKKGSDASNGSLAGYLYVIVPRIQFTGDAGIGGNQTSNATTDYSWQALDPTEASAMPSCTDCADAASNYAYYIWTPCGNSTQDVAKWGYIGAGKTVAASALPYAFKLPVVYLMKDGTYVEAPIDDFTVSPVGCTVNSLGVVSIAAGASGTATVTLASKASITPATDQTYTVTIQS